jgi:hypothetical protein
MKPYSHIPHWPKQYLSAAATVFKPQWWDMITVCPGKNTIVIDAGELAILPKSHAPIGSSYFQTAPLTPSPVLTALAPICTVRTDHRLQITARLE